MPICNCQVRCKQNKTVSESTYRRHKKFRDLFSVEFGEFITDASSHDHQVSVLPLYDSLFLCQMQDAHTNDNNLDDNLDDNSDDSFGVSSLFDETRNEELGNSDALQLNVVRRFIRILHIWSHTEY